MTPCVLLFYENNSSSIVTSCFFLSFQGCPGIRERVETGGQETPDNMETGINN